jgi:hypothetical protein
MNRRDQEELRKKIQEQLFGLGLDPVESFRNLFLIHWEICDDEEQIRNRILEKIEMGYSHSVMKGLKAAETILNDRSRDDLVLKLVLYQAHADSAEEDAPHARAWVQAKAKWISGILKSHV